MYIWIQRNNQESEVCYVKLPPNVVFTDKLLFKSIATFCEFCVHFLSDLQPLSFCLYFYKRTCFWTLLMQVIFENKYLFSIFESGMHFPSVASEGRSQTTKAAMFTWNESRKNSSGFSSQCLGTNFCSYRETTVEVNQVKKKKKKPSEKWKGRPSQYI